MVVYPPDEQKQAAAEYTKAKASGDYPTLVKLIDDYGVLRAVIRSQQ
jgi:hypothetical protein